MAKRPLGGDAHVELNLPVDGIEFEADLAALIRGVGSVPVHGSKTRLVYVGDLAMEVRKTEGPWQNSKVGIRVDALDLFIDRLLAEGYSFSELKDLEDETMTLNFQMYGGAFKAHARGLCPSKEECEACAKRKADNDEMLLAVAAEQRDGVGG
jgi:hypothetical protein